MRRVHALLISAALLLACPLLAQTPQSFSAQVGDIAFESGDDEILLVPVGDKFSLSASTRGAAGWPPPKTRVDRLSIVCDGFVEGQALVRDHGDFQRGTCNVTFQKGTPPMGGDPEATWTLDKASADNRFEISSANGKVYEGRFTFRLKDEAGNAVSVSNGRFVAEDRQY